MATTSTAVSVGSEHTCALTSAGGVQCWGENAYGQLGNGTTTNSRTPVDVVGLSSGVLAISAGEGHTCALTSAGGVKCWGDNSGGELGDGTANGPEKCNVAACSRTPVDVAGLSSGVAATTSQCALTSSGGVKCWGANNQGELGDGTHTGPEKCEVNACSRTPVDVIGLSSGVAAISRTCALTSAGAVKCWGVNASGQLGDGESTGPEICWPYERPCSATPVEVSGLSGIAAISAGYYHACALTSLDAVECWGAGGAALGNGTTSGPEECREGACSTKPVEVSELSGGVTAISAGNLHACALTSAGGVKCWGSSQWGQIGDGTATAKALPVDVSNLTSGVTAISAGERDTCALTSAGVVKCWGKDTYGQLGVTSTVKCERTPCNKLPATASGLAATCANNSGTVTISPGLSPTAAVQTVKVSGTLASCAGEPFTKSKYSATLTTAGPVSCAVLEGAGEAATGSAKYAWTPTAKASKGPFSLPLSTAPGVALVGETTSGSYLFRALFGTLTEVYSGAATCGTHAVTTGTFSGSAVTFE